MSNHHLQTIFNVNFDFFTVAPLGVSPNHVLLPRERSPSSLQYWWEKFTHLYSWVDWINESKVPCSRKQQQQQLMELGIEPGLENFQCPSVILINNQAINILICCIQVQSTQFCLLLQHKKVDGSTICKEVHS